jgi:phage I-like protein
VKEIEARQLLPLILDLSSAVGNLRSASALLAVDRKNEAMRELIQAGEDLGRVLSAAQQLVKQLGADEAG